MNKSIRRLITIIIISSSICVFPASAEWRQDNNGWWYSENNTYAKDQWKQINGKWYYFNSNGYMAHDTTIDGQYKVDNNGVWVQNTTVNTTSNNNSNNVTNINNGTINNGEIINNTSINNTNIYVNGINENNTPSTNQDTDISKPSETYDKFDNPYINETVAKNKKFDGTNGFKKVDDNKYIYYENGYMLNNCWKEFDDGIRYFDDQGIMVCDDNVTDIHLNSDGTASVGTRELSKEETRKASSGAIGSDLVHNGVKEEDLPYKTSTKGYSLKYIKYMCDVFGINLNIEYKDVYDKDESGQIINIKKEDGEHIYSRVVCESLTIYVGKYSSRLNLD
jgi:hypothetical protein